MTDDPFPTLAARLRQAADAEPPVLEDCSGRGIVVCAGGARLFTCAWLQITMLRRKLGCRLPIEVWHVGPSEMGPPMRALLEAAEVHVIDALEVARRHPVETLGGWQLKTYALLHSRFREILLLDADNLPVTDPEFLFGATAFVETGAVFWPDIVRLKAGNAIWAVSGLTADTGPSFETGQVLLDKRRHWRALNLAHWINQRHVDFEDMLYGDKDAFYVAWRMVGDPYHRIAHAPKLLEHTLCQRSPEGRVLFQHRNGVKWLLHGPNPRVEGFRLESECFALLSELRSLWDGTVFNPPDRSSEARAVERDLVVVGRFRLVWVASHERVITLRSHHLIEGGDSYAERYWFVADGEAGPELRLMARGVLTCVLRRDADSIWRGIAGGLQVELQPESPVVSCNSSLRHSALLAVIDDVLDRARNEREDQRSDYAITLATLAALEPAGRAYLESCASDPPHSGTRALLARAALARHLPTSQAPVTVRPGSGWKARSGNIDLQTEAMPKR